MAHKKGEERGDRDDHGHYLPGHSIGGPGRPKKERTIAYLQEQHLDQEVTVPVLDANGTPTGETRTTTNRQLFVESQTLMAINGDAQAARNLWDRQDGKVPETIEHIGGVVLNIVRDPVLDGEPDDGD